MRAKFRVDTVQFHGDHGKPETPRTYTLGAVYDRDTEENRRFNTATPYGELKMRVDNPAAKLEVGREYYLDFTPAWDQAEASHADEPAESEVANTTGGSASVTFTE